MNCRVEETNTFGRKLHIDISAEDYNAELNLKIRKLSTTAKVKGFRPGKVPVDVIKRYYGADIEKEVADTLMAKSYQEAIMEYSFKPMATPEFDDIAFDKDKGIHYTAYIEVIPDMQLNIDGLAPEKPICEIVEADIDIMVERLRKSHAKWQPKTEGATDGDRLTMDVEMPAEKGVVPDPLVDKSIVLGSNFLGKNFDSQLENVCAGERREVVMESFGIGENSDENADDKKCKVHVKQVEEAILPELNDDFFRACEIKEGGLETLRRLLKEGMERQLDINLKNLYADNIKNTVIENNQVDIPPAMLKERIAAMKERLMQNNPNKDSASNQMPEEFFEKHATEQVRLNVIFIHLADKYSLKASRRECDVKIAELATDYADPSKITNYYNNNAEAYQSIQGMVLEDKVVELLAEKVNPSEKQYSFYDIVGKTDQALGR
ncbi:MAG: trigger factor [Chromatiales bacterium]|nr:trigger factor [Chromatiales bacterium]